MCLFVTKDNTFQKSLTDIKIFLQVKNILNYSSCFIGIKILLN